MSCISCWPWCRSPPVPPVAPSPPVVQYVESKSVVRAPTPPPDPVSLTKHTRVLSTMYIKDGKAVVSYREITEEELNKKFGRVPAKTSEASKVRFKIDVEEPTCVSPQPNASMLSYEPSMAVLGE